MQGIHIRDKRKIKHDQKTTGNTRHDTEELETASIDVDQNVFLCLQHSYCYFLLHFYLLSLLTCFLPIREAINTTIKATYSVLAKQVPYGATMPAAPAAMPAAPTADHQCIYKFAACVDMQRSYHLCLLPQSVLSSINHAITITRL